LFQYDPFAANKLPQVPERISGRLFHEYVFLQYFSGHKPDTIISAAFSQSNHFSQVSWQNSFKTWYWPLEELTQKLPENGKRIWVHALSVGEVLSAQPLVRELRLAYPDMGLIFSASTKTGEELSRNVMAKEVDLFVPFPFDLYGVARKFINCIEADLFILIETDSTFCISWTKKIRRRSL
jgi:3-deoxy-D-manno-octulosonic-acid transferase